jgi:Amidase
MNPGLDIAARIARGEEHAREIAEATLARIRDADRQYNCFTALIAERALAEADAIDRRRARGEPLGPLAGVPYAVKNLFDVAGIVTLAGSKINADNAPAARDAFAISAFTPREPCSSARSTWRSTPTASPPRTSITDRRATRTIRPASRMIQSAYNAPPSR